MTLPTTQIPTRDKDFYLDRFKEAVKPYTQYESDRVRHDFAVEIYNGVAIVMWDKITKSPDPNAEERHTLQAFLWQVGSPYDNLPNLGWHYQGTITTLSGRSYNSFESILKQARKKADFFGSLYSHKSELIKLARTDTPSVWSNSTSIYNAQVNDVVRIRAFGRARLGKVIATTGNRFVVAYMTPSNNIEVHYKTLPLAFIYPKDEVAQP